MLYADKKIVKLFTYVYYSQAKYWYFRYRCNNIYNNFLADYFPNFWIAERRYLKGIVYRYRLHKKLGVWFRTIVKNKRSDVLFYNANVYLSMWEYYSGKKYYLSRYLKRAITS